MPLTVDDKTVAYYSACVPNCWMNCRLYAHVRDGKLVQTSPAPFPDPSYNRICLRGLTHPERVYNKERITVPLKRTGKRGENRWQEITWDEALDTIAENFTRIRDRFGSRAVAFAPISGNYGLIHGSLAGSTSRFAHQFGGTLCGGAIDMAVPTGISQVFANLAGGMASFFMGNQPEDMRYARTLIVWGSNLTESQPHNWHFVADALENGARLVVIDPRMSEIATKAHEWVRVRPGTDSALGLSFIQVILEEGIYDAEYIRNYTVGPFLVRGDNGRFLRESDLREGGSPEEYMVLDEADGQIKPLHEASKAQLLAEGEAKGIRVTSALQLLKAQADPFSPEKAESITGVPAVQARRVARLYAQNQPSFIYNGFGIDRWDNGDLTGRALATLAVLTGNLGKPGASPCGAMGGSAMSVLFMPGILDKWLIVSPSFAQSLNYLQLYDAVSKGEIHQYIPSDAKNPFAGPRSAEPEPVPYPIKAMLVTCGNPVSNLPNQNRLIQMFAGEGLEFIAVADQFLTDTARYADVFLPSTSWFEQEDVVGGIHPYLMKMEQAIAPVGESRSDFELFKGLAERMGMGDPWQRPVSDCIEEVVRNLGRALGSEERVLEEFSHDGITRLLPPGTRSFADHRFFTPTGRAEFYSEGVIVNDPSMTPPLRLPIGADVNPLPHFRPPVEAWPENPLYPKYPLVLIQNHSRWRVHTQFYYVPALREIDSEPLLDINEREASKRGIRQGDWVRVFNDRGEVVVRARVNNAYPDGLVGVDKGWQRHQFAGGGYQELTSERINPVHFNSSFHDILVEVQTTRQPATKERPADQAAILPKEVKK